MWADTACAVFVLSSGITINSVLECVLPEAASPSAWSGGNMAPGWLTVGSEVDSMRAAHAFHAIPVVGESHWGVKVHDVSIPGLSSANICNPSCAVKSVASPTRVQCVLAIFDTLQTP